MNALYHYTCAHSRRHIGNRGMLRPNQHRGIPGSPALVWLTDLDVPVRDGLGLTSEIIACDRTEFRYLVTDLSNVVSWARWAHERRVPQRVRDTLEEFGLPAHWFVSESSVPVVYDPIESGVLR